MTNEKVTLSDFLTVRNWSSALARNIEENHVTGLVLNTALGFEEPDISFLTDVPETVRSVHMIARHVSDLDPLSDLGERLEHLTVEAADDAWLDLSKLTGLRSLGGDWSLFSDTFPPSSALENLVVINFSERDLSELSEATGLKYIDIKGAQVLATLAGIERLESLEHLAVGLAPMLCDITDAAALAGALLELEFEGCPKIASLTPVRALARLRSVGVNDCGEISSLAPLRTLLNLEFVQAWGDTRIVDNDLTPLATLPKLREVRMRSRRSYRPKLDEIVSSLSNQ